MGKARLLVELDVKPDEADRFAEMFRAEFMTRSRKEAGCEQYELWREADNPSRMTIIEVWSSSEALDQHLSMEWFSE